MAWLWIYLHDYVSLNAVGRTKVLGSKLPVGKWNCVSYCYDMGSKGGESFCFTSRNELRSTCQPQFSEKVSKIPSKLYSKHLLISKRIVAMNLFWIQLQHFKLDFISMLNFSSAIKIEFILCKRKSQAGEALEAKFIDGIILYLIDIELFCIDISLAFSFFALVSVWEIKDLNFVVIKIFSLFFSIVWRMCLTRHFTE